MVIENRSWQCLLVGSPILQHCQVRSFYPESLPVLVHKKVMKFGKSESTGKSQFLK